MYAKCGALAKAKELLDELPIWHVASWNALIAVLAQGDRGSEALNYFERMHYEGLAPDAVTFACILKACGTIGALDKGQGIHTEIVKQGLLAGNVILGGALVNMYAKCGALPKAKEVLEALPFCNVELWNALIAGYAKQDEGNEALKCFEQMKHKGHSPNAITFTCILNACGSIGALEKGESIHSEIVRQGLLIENSVLLSAVVDMYARCGAFARAKEVLKKNHLQDMVSWSALIAGYVRIGHGEEALNCYEEIRCQGLLPDSVAYICILKACGRIGALDKGEHVHSEIAKQGLLDRTTLYGAALVDMYVKCGALGKARYVLEGLPLRNVVSWSALIAGYAQKECSEEALNCFEVMQHEGFPANTITLLGILKACGSIGALEKGEIIHDNISRQGLLAHDATLGNALVDMYAKCGAFEKAKKLLAGLPNRNVVSWNALIARYCQAEHGDEALNCFDQMQHEDISPNAITFICTLKACGSIGALDKGKIIHDEIIRQSLLAGNVVLGSALVDMYARCGAIAKAKEVLEELPVRDVVTWSTLIAGYAQGDYGNEALKCFELMQLEGFSPDKVTLLCVLTACSNSALLNQGQNYFTRMTMQYSIVPNLEHQSCLVTLFGRVGLLDNAMTVIEKMLSCCDPSVWLALLSACKKCGNVDFGMQIFRQAVQSHAISAAFYIYMNNIHATEVVRQAQKIEG